MAQDPVLDDLGAAHPQTSGAGARALDTGRLRRLGVVAIGRAFAVDLAIGGLALLRLIGRRRPPGRGRAPWARWPGPLALRRGGNPHLRAGQAAAPDGPHAFASAIARKVAVSGAKFWAIQAVSARSSAAPSAGP